VIPDASKSLRQGAVRPWQTQAYRECQDDLIRYARKRGIPLDTPWAQLAEEQRRWVLEGEGSWEDKQWYGVRRFFAWLETKAYKMHIRVLLSKYRAYTPCTVCKGARLKTDALLFRLGTREDAAAVLRSGERFTPQGAQWTTTQLEQLPGVSLHELMLLPIERCHEFFERLRLPAPLDQASDVVLREIRSRVRFLMDVGLSYLTLDRQSRTLSGGEVQRINLTTALGASLVNTLFVLDEPSIGLHPRDMGRVIEVMKRLKDAGNSLLVVEHDPQVMQAADRILDIGPGPGERGGRIVFFDTPERLCEAEGSLTADYLLGRKRVKAEADSQRKEADSGERIADSQRKEAVSGWRLAVSQEREAGGGERGEARAAQGKVGLERRVRQDASSLTANRQPLTASKSANRQPLTASLCLTGVRAHNLKAIDVEIPLHALVCVTGVSGSGKSTLVQDVLYPALLKHFGKPTETPGEHDSLVGAESLSDVVMVDQAPIGRTTRSNPASYVGAFDTIRRLFAAEPLAKERGYTPATFSFNSGGGRCPTCSGAGFEHVEMQFLSDVYLRCPDCDGKRYRAEVLEVTVNRGGVGRSIADVLEMTAAQAVEFFADERDVLTALQPLVDVGLDYLRLGQPVPTLSGGEAQRLKLAGHLAAAAKATPRGRSRGADAATAQEERSQRNGAGLGKLFLFDEPTTGLHFDDIARLLRAFRRLIDAGGSLLVIEHNLDVIGAADWIIDLGPEGGEAGGEVVCVGAPEQVMGCEASHTGRALKEAVSGWRLAVSQRREADSGERIAESQKAEAVSGWRLAVSQKREADGGERIADGQRGLRGGGPAGEWQAGAKHAARQSASSLSAIRSPLSASISIHGAREHNLKNIDVELPRDKFTVLTGVSGSGKSTLAFDIVFGEGQRRYLESLNAYARQFVQPASRPDVDAIFGIPPTVAIEQRTSRGGRKSTVATLTEIYHFLRLLYVKLGVQYCPDCDVAIEPQSFDAIAAHILKTHRGRTVTLLAPLVVARKGYYTDLAAWAAKKGYSHLRVDGEMTPTNAWPRLSRFQEHTIEAPAARLKITASAERELRAALTTALDFGKGVVHVQEDEADSGWRIADSRKREVDGGEGIADSQKRVRGGRGAAQRKAHVERAARRSGSSLSAIRSPLSASIYSTRRSCPSCARSFAELDPRLFSFNSKHGWCEQCYGVGLKLRGFDAEQSGEEIWWNEWLEEEAPTCSACGGERLNAVARNVRFQGRSIAQLTAQPVSALRAELARLKLRGREAQIARDVLAEIGSRLAFLEDVGLGYLALDRAAPTLSGGEAQRIRLAAQLGSNLQGVCYVLDEPTIGLHPRDNRVLLDTLERLAAKGNSLLVVEHDEDTIRRADHIVDLGPGAGARGGRIVGAGSAQELQRLPESVTGRFLANPLRHPLGSPRVTTARTPAIVVRGATLHNLRGQTFRAPLQRLTVITGVSGSGKSTLARDVLHDNLRAALSRRKGAKLQWRGCRDITGWEHVSRVLEVDQTPIGKTPRSCPATYVGFWDAIRRVFAQTPEARMRGYDAARFSFNTGAGRCAECEGQGLR
ncbi:MAG: hypothetical protein RBS02_14090, partial [Steroidobacteraceae bacterium]|nr:hypothetical protein [Steroidobacteraceae bacterium]